MRVTRAHENLIFELEGRPALELLNERAPSDLLKDPQWALHFLFVGLVPDPETAARGEYMVRNILSIDPEGGEYIHVHVEPSGREFTTRIGNDGPAMCYPSWND